MGRPGSPRSAMAAGRPAGLAAGSRALLCVLLLALAACRAAPGEQGELVLRLRWAPEHRAGLSRLNLEPDWGGVSRHRFRDAGWIRFGRTVDRVVLAAGDGSAAVLTTGRLPVGDYGRVFVSIPRVEGRDASGHRVAVNAHVEPIARPLTVRPEGRTVVDLVIAVLPTPPQSPFAEPLQAFIMDANLPPDLQAAAAAATDLTRSPGSLP